jgi:hypothetical protein
MTFMAALALSASLSFAQTTQPAATSPSAALELRATEAFNRSQYTVALPMFQKLAGMLTGQTDQADRLAMIQEEIRVCQRNLPPQVASAAGVTSVGATATAALPAAPPGIPMGADRKPHPAPKPGEVLSMEIKELGNFEYDAEHGSPIPADVKRLSGATIRLKGYMIPMDQADNISQFALVPSLFNCCYGQPPQIQHTIMVNCPKGKAVSYFPDEIIVQGKLTVEAKKDEGFVVSLFEIETSSVKPAPK